MSAAQEILTAARKLDVTTERTIEIISELANPRSTVDHRGAERNLCNTIGAHLFAGGDSAAIIAEIRQLAS